MKKNLKLFLIIGAAGLVSILGLSIWAIISLFSFGSEKLHSLNLNLNIASLEQKVNSLSGLKTRDCFIQFQALAQPNLWLERTLEANLGNLKSACLNSTETKCSDHNCESHIKEIEPNKKGDFI